MLQIVLQTLRGATAMGGLPMSFFWAAVLAYLVWAAGLGAAVLARFRVSRPGRPACGASRPVAIPAAAAMGH